MRFEKWDVLNFPLNWLSQQQIYNLGKQFYMRKIKPQEFLCSPQVQQLHPGHIGAPHGVTLLYLIFLSPLHPHPVPPGEKVANDSHLEEQYLLSQKIPFGSVTPPKTFPRTLIQSDPLVHNSENPIQKLNKIASQPFG